jgi:DNA repair exonuclease SbcCD ATPase subunit
MIHFKYVTLRNFLTYGNVPTRYELDLHRNTLIVGKNGDGKSAMADAICFALFNRTYRKLNKPLLVNSINKKDCVVEVGFRIGTKNFKIIRGIKPDIFEIWEDGVLIDEKDTKVGDYQEYLETNILKMDHKTFCQVIMVGTSEFKPFMQLSTPSRREVVENVLDIAIFSEMNDILKARIVETKNEFNTIERNLEAAKKETIAQKRVIQIMEEAADERVAEEEAEIEKLDLLRSDAIKNAEEIDARLNAMKRPDGFDPSELSRAQREVDSTLRDIKNNKKISDSIQAIEECPTCLQDVGHEHKHSIKVKLEAMNEALHAVSVSQAEELERLRKLDAEVDAYTDSVATLGRELSSANAVVLGYSREIEKHQSIISGIQKKTGDIKEEKAKLRAMADAALVLISRRSELLEEKNLQDVALVLLKDSGIKAAIIKEYIPIINQTLNKYLEVFGFDINFILDENFDETIHSRGRDKFVYYSFSEGQKKKIDIAILFSFRKVTEMKNSANCNLLIIDELVDNNLDSESLEAFLENLQSEEGNNFVISHRASPHIFDAVIEVSRSGDFSQYAFQD